MVHPSQKNRGFGRRKELPQIIITRGDNVRSYTVRPWLFGSIVSVFLTFGFGYLGATGYLLYRDDILDGAMARQAEIQYAYEDRIALLRSEIDRVTSRHLVETQSIESQVATLLDRQAVIDRRQVLLDELIAQARKEGIPIAAMPRPVPRPGERAEAESVGAEPVGAEPDVVVTGSIKQPVGENGLNSIAGSEPALRKPFDATNSEDSDEDARLRPLLRDIQSSLDRSELLQVASLDVLREASQRETLRLVRAIKRLGVKPPAAPPLSPFAAITASTATGGPFIPANSFAFVERVASLDDSLEHIRRIRKSTATLPLGKPIAGAQTTSRFGRRMDPFLKRPAFHAGIDFRAKRGTPVRATAAGKVTYAGRNGGYGRMVEISHAHGLKTRYAHLSRISVRKGMMVDAETVIGRVGSTGRSTGPHLHYETLRGGKAVDPSIYLAARRML